MICADSERAGGLAKRTYLPRLDGLYRTSDHDRPPSMTLICSEQALNEL